MDTLISTYNDDEDDVTANSSPSTATLAASPTKSSPPATASPRSIEDELITNLESQHDEHGYSPLKKKQKSTPSLIPDVQHQQLQVQPEKPEELTLPESQSLGGGELGPEENEDEADDGEFPPKKKPKSDQTPIDDVQPQQLQVQSPEALNQLPSSEQGDELTLPTPEEAVTAKSAPKSSSKKSKKKNNNNVWTRPASRKGKKKAKSNQNNGNHTNTAAAEERVFIAPVPKFPDKNDDNSEISICLSRFYKAEKVEISEDRLSAGSTKGYRMVRATRGVVEGAWYFEIKVMHLGDTGHTRLGWSTEKGDLQAPVGFDANSFGYRDVDGSKVHKALREEYGKEGYGEGDVLGFYINLPDGSSFEPKPPRYVWFKGQRYVCAPDAEEDPPRVVPGSEICFFKNGICQGTAFTDLFGGRYYPAASMYTLPNQSNCLVKFNFGPDFDSFPVDFGGRSVPRPMIEVAYHGSDGRVENGNGSLWNSTRTSSMLKVTKEQGTLFVEASEIDID